MVTIVVGNQYQNVKPFWILLPQEMMAVIITGTARQVPFKSSQKSMKTQTGCPFCQQTDSIKFNPLKATGIKGS